MREITSRVKNTISKKCDTSETLFLHLTEEVGEVATALNNQHRQRKQLKETAAEECVDVILCALGLFFQEGGTIEQLEERIEKKLARWESRVEKLKQGKK